MAGHEPDIERFTLDNVVSRKKPALTVRRTSQHNYDDDTTVIRALRVKKCSGPLTQWKVMHPLLLSGPPGKNAVRVPVGLTAVTSAGG